ncbi:MAG: sugar ABC transporter permease [Oscillospiraceae bacterium]|nr:sugar ABC transporter permease [Oscillospiraceae bacterium]
MQGNTGSARSSALGSRWQRRKKTLVAYSFIAPNFIGFAVFTLVPMIMAVVLAFLKWDGSWANPIEFVGLDNFARLLHDKKFNQALVNTVAYALITVPLTMASSLGLAILLNRKIFARNFFRTMMFFPYVASMVAVTAVWNMLFNPAMGPVNMILYALGVDKLPRWSADPNWIICMGTVILFSIWKYMGYFMIIYLAGLQGINPELYEAASLDGATGWQKFCNVTLPQLRPTTFFVTVMLTIQCFKVYDMFLMITNFGPGGRTRVLVSYIYDNAFVSRDFGYASAVSMVLFALVLLVTLVQYHGNSKLDG